MNPPLKPPVAKIEPHTMTLHGHKRIDPYYWMKERDSSEVLTYLQAENSYTDQVMSATGKLQDTLFAEMVGRVKQTDMSVPVFDNGAYYYRRFVAGGEYPLYCRRVGGMDQPEELMLDGNQLAEGKPYFRIANWSVSHDQRLLAYAVDCQGRRIFSVHIKNLESGETYRKTLTETAGDFAWSADGSVLFYTKLDLETLQPNRLYRHQLGTPQSDDVLIYEENDGAYYLEIFRSRTKKFIYLAAFANNTSEYRFIPADQPHAAFQMVQARQEEHEYALADYDDHFIILTNLDAMNFRLVRTSIETPSHEFWVDLIPHRAEVLIEEFTVFEDWLVLVEWEQGLPHLRCLRWNGEQDHRVTMDESVYHVELGHNPDHQATSFRFLYQSLCTPRTVYNYQPADRRRERLKRQEVEGDFDPENYLCERLYAKAEDGQMVPISLVFRRETPPHQGDQPLFLQGYGAYGLNYETFFSVARLSLLDRGFGVAIAHIRGGSELGRSWYENGRRLAKKNTFNDFISAAEHLRAIGYVHKRGLFVCGRSAGGILIGDVVNRRPDLFDGAVAGVPFVDCLTTMLDPSLPLTVSEYDEWGNPNDAEFYDYMLSYSPYDQVRRQNYPPLLVHSGYHDSQVQYWEPAKWVAKLRANKQDSHPLLLHMQMEAGHSGSSGRFQGFRDTALVYAFLIGVFKGELSG